MNKFCSVAPLQILEEMNKKQCLGNKHLLLAHEVVKRTSDEYRRYSYLFGIRAPLPTDHIILDNSCYELKSPVDSEMVWDAVQIARPTCVVLPDVWMDGPATAHATHDVLYKWLATREQLGMHNLQFMCIPQGKTVKEWEMCAEALGQLPGIDWWGVPRNMRDVLNIHRLHGVMVCNLLNIHRKIHLFGFSDDYMDDAITCRSPCVESIDSTTPLRAGSLDIDFTITDLDLPPRGDWWDTAQWNDKIITNLNYANRIF